MCGQGTQASSYYQEATPLPFWDSCPKRDSPGAEEHGLTYSEGAFWQALPTSFTRCPTIYIQRRQGYTVYHLLGHSPPGEFRILPYQYLRDDESRRHPCQEGNHNAKGYAIGDKHSQWTGSGDLLVRNWEWPLSFRQNLGRKKEKVGSQSGE